MEAAVGKHRQSDNIRGFDYGAFLFRFPMPFDRVRTMSRVHRFCFVALSVKQLAHNFAEAVPTVAHGQNIDAIPGADGAPAGRNRFGSSGCCQRAFEFVRDDEDVHSLKN